MRSAKTHADRFLSLTLSASRHAEKPAQISYPRAVMLVYNHPAFHQIDKQNKLLLQPLCT
jgi:hypothetical protein